MTAIGAALMASPAEAAYWSDGYTSYYDAPVYPSAQPVRKRHARAANRHSDTKLEKQAEQQAKPKGPLVIAVSIDQQRVKIYDSNGLFAESPVSTGMRGHPTPMGVFSVIQKQKLHHSNIYSNAPMPYMQRITWSGVAMHAGVLPGYPASHGCIRMPMAFALKMWGWTRMNARVIVAPGEVAPESFSHPLLVAKKQPAEPMASEPPKPVTSAKSDKAAAAEPADLSTDIQQLRASLDDRPAANAPVRTADASEALPGAVSDASSGNPSVTEAKPEAAPDSKPADGNSAESKPADADAAKVEAAKPDAVAADPGITGQIKPVEDKAPAQVQDASKTAAPAAPAPSQADTGQPAPNKDQSRPSEPEAAKAALNLPAAKPDSQIAVFVSGKDSKLYVRQNWKPLFDVPVTIAADGHPLGTHVFTAEVDKDGSARWTVTSLPASRHAAEHEEPRKSRKHKNELSEQPKPVPQVDTPAAALDRLSIPPEAMARIAEAISSGSSLIVSDQGINAGETGEGTDFIIRLH